MKSALPLDLLACPACRGSLAADAAALSCAGCGARYDHVLHVADLVPADVREAMADDPSWRRWREAIRGLESWRARRKARARGGALPSDGATDDAARDLFERAGVRGTVIDVGAKDGAKRRAMPDGVRYVGVDPFAEHTPGLPAGSVVVRGVAEALPVADGVADAVVSLAAFDYFVDGARALAEMARVLAPRGALALVVSAVPRSVARARRADTRAARVGNAALAALDVGALPAAGLVAAALTERHRPHTHYYTREEVLGLVAERFEVHDVRDVPRPSSNILYIAARKR